MKKEMGTQKLKKSAILLRLGKYVIQNKTYVALALILTFTANSLSLLGPELSGLAIDAIAHGTSAVDFSTVFYYCGLLIAVYLISGTLGYVLSIVMIKLSQKIVYKMRKDVFEKLTKLPVSYFDKIQAGELISLISYDIDTINASLSSDLMLICTSIITVIGSLIAMIFISPVLLLVFLVTVPVSIAIAIRRSKVVRPLFRERSKALAEMNGFVEETISGSKTIKAYNCEDIMLEKFAKRNNRAVGAYYDADYAACIIGPAMNFINNVSLSIISVFGAILFIMGNISIGNVSSFILYSRRFTGPINEIGNILSELTSACSAADRVFRVLDAATEREDDENAEELNDVKGRIKFDQVYFSYLPETDVIKDLNLDVKEGSRIAIVGHTGAGKTTIVNLLMRFYDINSGKITIDGKDIDKITRASLRKAYTMVLQETWLFEGSIFDNIAYGREGTTLEEVINVAKSVDIHDFILTLPKGYDCVLNDDGVNLSKGQKQLITIARAMLNDSKILILDEATSNVDTRTEIKIHQAMELLMQNKTSFVIAHRLSTIKNSDVILLMKDGQVIEQGSHNELILANGAYADLYNSQFE